MAAGEIRGYTKPVRPWPEGWRDDVPDANFDGYMERCVACGGKVAATDPVLLDALKAEHRVACPAGTPSLP